jgi:hypothetical protein
MADPRTFTLIGNFQDNITPALESINKSIDAFKRNMASMSSKKGGGYNDVTQSVGKLVSAQRHLKEAIEGVGAAAKSATQDLKDYKSMMGKVSSAHYHVQKSGTAAGKAQTKFWSGADKELDAYRKNLESLAKKTRISPANYLGNGRRRGSAFAGGALGGGGGRGPNPPFGGGGGGSFRRNRGSEIGEAGLSSAFAFGQELGFGISQPVQTAIFSGFQLGVGLMARTMQYVQSSFAERVQDQMTDLQSAGGYYSISQRQKDPMFTSLTTALRFTQQTNDVMERLAGDLPGKNEDYVAVSKRIGDSVMRLVDSNEKGSVEFARELLAKTNTPEGYKGISLQGPQAREGALQVILGELTKKTVLAGFGGATGRGGPTGPYGLPAQIEKLITDPNASFAQLSKYASVFGDPKIMNALERAMPELEKAGPDMLARTKVINKMLDEIASPEMISAMRKSMAGVLEAYQSAFFSPGTGLFGFGRKLEAGTNKMQPLTDVYGRFIRIVERNGKKVEEVVKTAEDAQQVDMDVFNMFSDIVTNYATILKPIVDNLYLLWDPMESIADVLREARIISINILQSFRNYVAGLEDFANKNIAEGDSKNAFLATKNFRAALLTISNIFTELGVFSEADFSKFQKMIIDPKASIGDLGNILKSFATTFFDSEVAFNIGKFFGELVKAFGQSLSDMTGFFSGLSTSQLAQGFMAGLGKDGIKVITKIFEDIYNLLFNAAKAILPLIPWQVYALAAAGIVIPAIIASIGVSFANGIVGMLLRMKELALSKLTAPKAAAEAFNKVKITSGGAGVGSGRGRVTGASSRNVTTSGGSSIPGQAPSRGGARVTTGRGGMSRFTKFMRSALGMDGATKSVFGELFGGGKGLKGLKGDGLKGLFGRGIGGLGKGGGILTAGVGIFEALKSLLSGESLGTALGKGAGPVLGTIIGTALLGPLGGVVGGMIGSMEAVTGPLGDAVNSVMGTLGTTFEFLGQIGNDLLGFLNGLIQMLPGVSEGFNLLEFALFALLSPFKLLEIAINGLYDLYLTVKKMIPGVTLSAEEQKRLDERHTVALTDQLTIMGRLRSGYSLEQQKREEYAKWVEAKQKGDKDTMNRSAEYMKSIEQMLKERRKPGDKDKGKDKPSPTGGSSVKVGYLTKGGVKGWQGSDGNWTPLTTPKPANLGAVNAATTALGGDPSASLNLPKMVPTKKPPKKKTGGYTPSPKNQDPVFKALSDVFGFVNQAGQNRINQVSKDLKVPKPVQETEANTSGIDKKAGEQVKETQKTNLAIKDLAAKITPQTNLQTSVAAIYNLLASGMLRVQTNQMPPGFNYNQTGWPTPTDNVRPGTGTYNPFLNPGGLLNAPPIGGLTVPPPPGFYKGTWGDAISKELQHAGPGAHVVLANSNEAIIPPGSLRVASGYGMGGGGAVINGGINVTVNGSGVSDPQELAAMVAWEIQRAIDGTDSLFV